MTVKKFYSDYYLTEIREILNKRISNNNYFTYKNGETISNKQEVLILSEILFDNKLYLKSIDESKIKIFLNNQLITSRNINQNISLSELKDKLNLSKDFFSFTIKRKMILKRKK